MHLFLDTSSLLKLYCKEGGTAEIVALIANSKLKRIYLTEIAKIEFASAIWKKVRTQELTPAQAAAILELFANDARKFRFVEITRKLLEDANTLVTKYRIEGLRTLDSIQLATCVALRKEADLFLTSDNLLKSLLQKEGLPANLPEV